MQTSLRTRLAPFAENTAEATAACLLAMVQGNVLALTLSHWLIASKTGLFAGALTAVLVLISRVRRPWVISVLLGLATFFVDYWVHPGMFGPIFAEALVTGMMAALLCLMVHFISGRIRLALGKSV